MKRSSFHGLGTVVFCLLLSTAALRADDWKTTDGKVYQNVSVVKAEPDAVTILHQDGGARVPLANLSPDLQKQFNYDPTTAKAAADARTKADRDNAKALQAEMNQARAMRQAKLIAENPNTPDPSTTDASTPDSSTPTGPISSVTQVQTKGEVHHSMSELVDVNQKLRDDHPDLPHTTTAYLLKHTSLEPDSSDPTHHSMDSLLAGDPLARP